MKKSLGLSVLLMLVLSFAANAQSWVTWEWDAYHTKFSVPSDFRVIENNNQSFSASNSEMNLTIYPRTDEHLSYGQMLNSLASWARSNGIRYSEGPEYMEDLNGYWGTFIDGFSGNTPVALLLLVDPDYPDVSMYVWLSYGDYSHDDAVEILLSFTPN